MSLLGKLKTLGWTFTGTSLGIAGTVLKLNGTQVLTTRQTAVVDIAAATATNPTAPTAFTAPIAGAVQVTSNAATDLTTTAAALATLVTEVGTYETAISALIVDVADLRTKVNSILAKIRTHGLIAP